MGDRTWAHIYYMEKDEPEFGEVLFGDRDGNDQYWEDAGEVVPGVLGKILDEINYGGYDEWEELAHKKVVFYGTHGPGGCYPEFSFASDGSGRLQYLMTEEGTPIVHIDESLKPGENDIENVREYYEALRKVETEMARVYEATKPKNSNE